MNKEKLEWNDKVRRNAQKKMEIEEEETAGAGNAEIETWNRRGMKGKNERKRGKSGND